MSGRGIRGEREEGGDERGGDTRGAGGGRGG